jgi:phosphatidylserine decarboxylase
MMNSVLVPIHRAGWPFIAIFFGVAVILGFLWEPLFWLGLVATAWCVYFFRDPPRTTPNLPGLVISPADGVVQSVNERVPPPELDLGNGSLPCVCVFMNVFDVHVNRAPVAGRITKKVYHPGQFLNASLDKASELNERLSWKIEAHGAEVGLVQIAGLVARRIIGFSNEGDQVDAGDRVGLIRFGSRCDIYMPTGTAIMVQPGQRAVAGETVIADLEGRIAISGASTS